MKSKIIYIAWLTLLFSSCEKAEEIRYDNTMSALNIWLGANLQPQDSLIYNYAFKSLNERDTIQFSVRLSGLPADQDREFQLKAIGGDTERIKEGVHYEFPKYVLKANAYEGVFPIVIKRSADFKAQQAKIVFGLSDGGEFIKGAVERSQMTVILKEEFSKPANWDVDPFPYARLSTFFGAYSDVKFRFITTAIGTTPTFKVRSNGTPVPPDEVSYTQAQYWQSRCKIELAAYNAALEAEGKGPLKESEEIDAALVTFP